MRYVDEYRDADLVRRLTAAIRETATRPWTLMEICGGQTHTIVKYDLPSLLPPGFAFVHGPGCPVCVTPTGMIDAAVRIAALPDTVVVSYGDMLRVPGTDGTLLAAKARGGDVRIVYTPLDAVRLARTLPGRNVVFFAVGFETTAPANAMAVVEARRLGLPNFTMLCAHVLVPPALRAILSSPGRRIDGVLAAGHVCTVMGYGEYEPIAAKYRVPIVITGFEPADILQGVLSAVRDLEAGSSGVTNCYARSVRRVGNEHARRLLSEVFEETDRAWRGIGTIPRGGLRLRDAYAEFDAERVYDCRSVSGVDDPACMAGLVLRGELKPGACAEFGSTCTPEHPRGAPMVSSEGACAAYFHYRAMRTTEVA